MVNRGRAAGSILSPVWRVWLVGLVIAAVDVTALAAAWHAEHDTDTDCVVCDFETESPAELAGHLRGVPGDTPELASHLSVTSLVLAHLDEQVPTRAPPLS